MCSELRTIGIQDVKRISKDHTGFSLKQTDLEDFPCIFQQLSKVSKHILIFSWLHTCRCEAFFLILEVLFECK